MATSLVPVNVTGNVTSQFSGGGQVQIGAVGPASEAGINFGTDGGQIYRNNTGILATQSHFRCMGLNSNATAGSFGNTGLRVANRNSTTNNWAAIQFDSASGGLTATIQARNLDHTNHYGELWFYSRSAAGNLPRLRIPGTGGLEVYGDASQPVLSQTSNGHGSIFATLGSELLTNGGFTGGLTGWTAGAGWSAVSDTAQHTAGNTATLTQALTGMSTTAVYYVTVVITNRTAGSVSINLGVSGMSPTASTGTASYGIKAGSTTPTLTITPTTDFDGQIDVVSLQLAPGLNSGLQLKDSATGSIQGEIRSNSTLGNHVWGNSAGVRFQAGVNNSVAIGNAALGSYTGGLNNGIGSVAIGSNALAALVYGNYNIALGYQALQNLVYGASNVAIGNGALQNSTLGHNNTAIGYAALLSLTSGINNVAAGHQAGLFVTTGNGNVCFGPFAGVGNSGTSTNALTTGINNVFIGINSRLGATTQRDHMVVIGNNARGDGNHAIAIGLGTSAGATGAVAIGTDSAATGASTATANMFVLGTANHLYSLPGASFGFGVDPVTRRSGWGTPSGTLTRTTFDPATATLTDVGQRLAALITDLKAYGWLAS
jgi:hypothetical protein